MTINEYQVAALRTANPALTQMEQLQNGIMGLNGEAGECIDLIKKHLFQGHTLYVSSYFSDQKITLAATDRGIVVRVNGVVKGNLFYSP